LPPIAMCQWQNLCLVHRYQGKPPPTLKLDGVLIGVFIRHMAPNPRVCGKLRGYKCRDRRDGLVCSHGAME
jgi:hypothetical protein